MSFAEPADRPARPSRRRLWFWLLAAIAIAATGLAVWWFTRPAPQPAPKADLVAAAHANARGVGLMERFVDGQAEAISAFEEAVRLAPDWTPAKINLGIALLNNYKEPGNLERALGLFADILAHDPDNPYAHFCSGIILFNQGKFTEASRQFEAVNRIDPEDPHAWYWRGKSIPDSYESPVAKECFEKALKLDPYLNAARYALAQHALIDNDALKKKLLDDFQALHAAGVEDAIEIKSTEMGRYADLIGRSPAPAPGIGRTPLFEPLANLSVKLEPGSAWATSANLDELGRAIRGRFGMTILFLDYDNDGRPDLLLLSAVVRHGKVGDLLLHNDGNNVFTDVSTEMGLSAHPGSFGAAIGDFDNDGYPDIAFAGATGLSLFRNAAGKKYADLTPFARFDREPGVYICASWLDLDQDGDLDLVTGKFAQTPEQALKQLRGDRVEATGRLVAYANVGEAPAHDPNDPLPPLTCAFRPITQPEALRVQGPVVGIIAADLDGDRDIDLLVLVDGQPPVSVLNDRVLRFHRGEPLGPLPGKWNGGYVLEANGDDQADLVLIEMDRAPKLLASKRDQAEQNLAGRFTLSTLSTTPTITAAWCDLDLDGHTDMVGLSADRKPVFLQGDGKGHFSAIDQPFGAAANAAADLHAAIPFDLDGDCRPDLVTWSEREGLKCYHNLGNGNNGLKVKLTGRMDRGKNQRTNTDGVGCFVRVQSGPLRTAAENTTLFAGPGQSRLPLHFGIGKAEAADVVRVRWPDGVIQAELNQAPCLVTIPESNRKETSCPLLFAWDGERFSYITDFLGAGSMGETGPDGTARPPRPEESVKIEPRQLASRDGKYTLKLAEPMDEVMYLDHVRLDVIDHPPELCVFPDERFATSDPQPTQERLFFKESERIFAERATDHRGRDVTRALRDRDGNHVEDFAHRSWLGFAEEHAVELAFDLSRLPANRRLFLVLAGWTDYAYPESIYAADQAGVPVLWPILEQRQLDGTWKQLGDLGLPAGLTRVMTREVTNLVDRQGGPLRIRTNQQVYWDQVFICPLAAAPSSVVTELPVLQASLEHRGFVQEYRPGGKLPVAYDYNRLEPVSVNRWLGRVTKTGDITPLLGGADDRCALCGPGDEITTVFDASRLPPLKPGWQRSFILKTTGYSKDTAPTTQTGGDVGPLPYRAMPRYPYDPRKEPEPAHVQECDRSWNTRPVGRR
jgi:hypothetical protein